MYGLGQVSANSLDDSQVPYKSMPIYLSRITTMDQLEDYAAGGFHVCVGRGSVGGAKEGSISYGQRLLAGRTFVTPTGALNRPDLVKAWSDAADAYKAAFNMAVVGSFVPAGGIDAVRVQILAANSLAGKAYALEGTIPPKDPGTGSTEVVSMSSSASDLINGAVTGAANAAGTTEKKKGIGMYLAFGAAALLVGFFAFRPESSMAGLGRARYRREEDLSDCGCGG